MECNMCRKEFSPGQLAWRSQNVSICESCFGNMGPEKDRTRNERIRQKHKQIDATLWLLEYGTDEDKARLSEDRFKAAVISFAESHEWDVYSIPDSRMATMKAFPDLWMIRDPGDYKSGTQRQTLIMYRELKTVTGGYGKGQEELLQRIGSAGEDADTWRPTDWERIKREIE